METKYPRIEPQQRDHMPPEVAIEHLTNPRSRIGGGFRRACREARETVYTSQFPIRLAIQDEDSTHIMSRDGIVFNEDFSGPIPPSVIRKSCVRVYDTAQTPKTPETRFNAKLKTLPLAKLNQIVRRCNRRSDKMFAASQKVAANTKLSEDARAKLADHFQAQSAKFDWLHGLTKTEINRRLQLCEKNK